MSQLPLLPVTVLFAPHGHTCQGVHHSYKESAITNACICPKDIAKKTQRVPEWYLTKAQLEEIQQIRKHSVTLSPPTTVLLITRLDATCHSQHLYN